MGREQIDRVLMALEGGFAGALAGEDEAAARDLAFSLAQDVPVIVDILRDGGRLVLGGSRVPITRVGHDFLEAGPWLVPTERAVVALGREILPVQITQVFLGALRLAARHGNEVAVGLVVGAEQAGVLVRAGATHVVVKGPVGGPVAVPIREIAYVRRVRGGSTGEP